MCFVSYVPTTEGYLLGSNRDEHVLRPAAIPPSVSQMYGWDIMMPRDGQAGGTWIAARADGISMVLLNGAFEPHAKTGPYRISRGSIITDLLPQVEAAAVLPVFQPEGIEPFTLIMAAPQSLQVWRWDGHALHAEKPDAGQAHCWSSATLYNEGQVHLRAHWFFSHIQNGCIHGVDNLKQFHRLQGRGNPATDIRMQRTDGIQSVSTTIIHCNGSCLQMDYCDYLSGFNSETALTGTVSNAG